MTKLTPSKIIARSILILIYLVLLWPMIHHTICYGWDMANVVAHNTWNPNYVWLSYNIGGLSIYIFIVFFIMWLVFKADLL